MTCEAEAAARGFLNNGDSMGSVPVYGNGTVHPRRRRWCNLGYQADQELGDDSDRRKEGMPPKERIPSPS